MRTWSLLGLDTFEMIHVDNDNTDAFKRPPPGLQLGPKISTGHLGIAPDKRLFLYPEHLKLLYDRFADANPKGVVQVLDDEEYEYAPQGLTDAEIERLEEERKIFVDLFYTDEEMGYPHARKYLLELFQPEMLRKMANDPWLDADLLRQAKRGGIVPGPPGWTSRWSPEWRAYCDRLIADGKGV